MAISFAFCKIYFSFKTLVVSRTWRARDEGVFYKVQRLREVCVVSNVQLYVDLYNYPARGREAGEHLRREVIRF